MSIGVGFYSPQETTIFFLKALLLSFWFGIDLVAVLIATTFAPDIFAQHRILTAITLAIMLFGTIFAVVFAWAAGSLFLTNKVDLILPRSHSSHPFLKRHSWQLNAISITNLSILLSTVTVHFMPTPQRNEQVNQIAQSSPAIVKKCAEVASLEQQQFQANEQDSMEKCLVQYGQKNNVSRHS